MSCKDYQQYIQQWFNYVLDAHVARCESCTAFFLQLTQTTANDLERLQAVHAVAAHAAAEAQAESSQSASGSPSLNAAPAAVSQPVAVPGGAASGPGAGQNAPGAGAGHQSPAHNQIGVVPPAQGPVSQSGQHAAMQPPGQGTFAQAQTAPALQAQQSPQVSGQASHAPAQGVPDSRQATNMQGQPMQAQAAQAASQQAQAASGQAQPAAQAAALAGTQQVQQSPQAQPFPKISRISPESIPKLAPTEGVDNSSVGRLFEIGKFILSDDDRDILKRMTSDEPQRSGVKILSHRDSESLQAVLGQVSRINTVVGWVIISNDGLLIYSTLPEHFDAENIAVRALSIFMGSEDSSEKCGFGQLRQVVMRTAIGTLIISNFSGGLFVTVATANDAEATVELIQQIRAVT